ncbi:LuxR family transcriptional regulator [Acetobacterium wieringae]|uniref:LuxR family transcriptional regulator n=1 Tax=Acetobacterium wieringae TaxID=52694 RepID=A0A5D0WSQ7_9FIRM|nr:LuxR C-terminal-related transcriptional regulator [Acetobacterium wieringae]TYC87199.1 LuxR family transcriptional regulator [Acetobacterium wieringae]
MNGHITINARRISVAGFSFLFAYILSFQFEGQVLYSLLDLRGTDVDRYILAAIIAHFAGLFTCGLFVKSQAAARSMMLGGMGLCLAASVPFFFAPSSLWLSGLIFSGYFSGCAVAAWGFFLRAFTPKNERIKSCADVLIYSNLLMIAVNVFAMNRSPFIGLSLSMLCLVIGIAFIWMLPLGQENEQDKTFKNKTHGGIKNQLILLCFFVFIITINSGLMYQVINPAFEHLTGLVSWYWAVPYIVALVIMRNLPMKAKRSRILYIGMAMIIGAFISFMLLGRNTSDYLTVDTLMLGACGIFDLFWWSILGEMLDYSDNPTQTFGIGLSANVFGILCGGVLGMAVTSMGLPGAEVAVIALTVVCVTLVMLPPLNHQLVLLLKSHAYLAAYDNMSQSQQTDIVRQTKTLDPLTVREQEVLQLILSGKSNREIAGALFISESTVKTHARNIFSKYDVGSRAELISTLLKNQRVE